MNEDYPPDIKNNIIKYLKAHGINAFYELIGKRVRSLIRDKEIFTITNYNLIDNGRLIVEGGSTSIYLCIFHAYSDAPFNNKEYGFYQGGVLLDKPNKKVLTLW